MMKFIKSVRSQGDTMTIQLAPHAWIALTVVCIFSVKILDAKAQESPTDSTLQIVTIDKGIPTFRTGVGMTEIERMITLSASGCITQQEIGGKMFHFPPCGIVEELRGSLSESSKSKPLLSYLTANDFKCRNVVDEMRCRNEFKSILTPPRDVITGEQVNSDIENTFITEVSIRHLKPGPVSIGDINVKFTRLQR
jgi:hypothetical protein